MVLRGMGEGMSFAAMSWLLLLAYALHMLEEFMLDWRDWAAGVLGLPVSWPDFYVTNAVVVVLGIGAAEVARSCRSCRSPSRR